jgi:hypothetical protein
MRAGDALRLDVDLAARTAIGPMAATVRASGKET